MNAKRVSPACVYCGGEGSTVDHVPPKLLLRRPFPKNLITVPACRKCNASFQANDEYMRFVVSVDLRSAKSETVQATMPAILRSLKRGNAERFTHSLVSRMEETSVLGADGRPLGNVFEADQKRINAAGERMVRGLFFVESGRPISPSVEIRIASKPGIAASDPVVIQFARMYASCSDRRTGVVGEAFSYTVASRPEYSIWMLLLYGHFCWLATIGGCPLLEKNSSKKGTV